AAETQRPCRLVQERLRLGEMMEDIHEDDRADLTITKRQRRSVCDTVGVPARRHVGGNHLRTGLLEESPPTAELDDGRAGHTGAAQLTKPRPIHLAQARLARPHLAMRGAPVRRRRMRDHSRASLEKSFTSRLRSLEVARTIQHMRAMMRLFL